MQTTISGETAQNTSPISEEQPVTFQIALVGRDGLVIGSDRLGRYTPIINGVPQLAQTISQQKYYASESQSIICFAAGSATAIHLARQISIDCDPLAKLKGATESEWQDAIYRVTAIPLGLPANSPSSQIDDEILIARADVSNAFWLVIRRPTTLPFPTILKIQQRICTGGRTAAQFLPSHLWTQESAISDLKTLALLTLSYASQEEPSSVGPPFDIMTLDQTGHISWSVHDPIHQQFQRRLESLLAEYEG